MKHGVIKRFAFLVLAALALTPFCHAQAQLTGDWHGLLSVEGNEMNVILHIAADKDGNLKVSADNPDQGAMGIQANTVTFRDSKLRFTVDAYNGVYEGTVNADATAITGTWTMDQPAELNFKRVAAAPAAATPAFAAAVPAGAAPAPTATIAGDWQGVLGGQLHLILHIAAKDGGFTATLDSVDQGAMGIPVTTVTLKDSKLSLVVDAVHGTYDGTINAGATEIDGTWSQVQPMPLTFTRAAPQAAAPAPKPAPPTEIDGLWLGSLDAGAMKLRMVFKLTNTADGLTAQMQSPDQSPAWLNATSVARKDNAITITLTGVGIVFEGKIAADLGSIDGTFTQQGNAIPLVVKHVKDVSALSRPRPQNPVKPYPYREEEVTYVNKTADNMLAATLTVPPGKGPFPAALLIVGSGPHDRDESLLGHSPFLVLSDYLTRKGIVVLRADKRGVGKSTGNYAKATTVDFADDAQAGVAFLKTRAEVDQHRIGLVGHSEGGVIAPIVAARDRDVAFIVMMAGTGVPGDQIIVEQSRLIAAATGQSKEKADDTAEKERETVALLKLDKDPPNLETVLGVKLATEGVPDAAIAAQIKALTSPWFRYFINYDPATALRKVTCPVLAINGSLDLQVPPALNLPAIRKALAEAGNTHYEVDELSGLNHLFQDAKTGAPAEYAEIEETMSPVALDKMASWILKQ